MKYEGHLRKAKEIDKSLQRLLPDPKGENVIAIVELSYGIAHHLIAYGMQLKYNEHIDIHAGIPRMLRRFGEVEIASLFESLDILRQGRWYGGKGDGEVVKECIRIINSIKEWIRI